MVAFSFFLELDLRDRDKIFKVIINESMGRGILKPEDILWAWGTLNQSDCRVNFVLRELTQHYNKLMEHQK